MKHKSYTSIELSFVGGKARLYIPYVFLQSEADVVKKIIDGLVNTNKLGEKKKAVEE